jgi:TrfA protein
MNRDTNTAPTLEEADEASSAAAILERQISETAPNMSADLRRVMARLGASIAKKSITQVKPEPEPSKAEQKGELILFPKWADERRATVHAIFRSALFPALNNKQPRRYYLEQTRVCSVEGVDVLFMGQQFDQSDLDVYLELLNIAHETPFGVECCFTAYSLLKALGRRTGKADYQQLHTELIRLCAGTVDMTDHRVRYFGHLVESGIKDEITKHYKIRISPDLAPLFKAGMWATLDSQQRRALGRNQTAKALHAYYSTHAAPGPHTFEKLAALVGLNNTTNPRKRNADIIKAHGELKRVGFLSDYEAGADTIKPTPNHTPSQARHIVKKIIKSRKPRKP